MPSNTTTSQKSITDPFHSPNFPCIAFGDNKHFQLGHSQQDYQFNCFTIINNYTNNNDNINKNTKNTKNNKKKIDILSLPNLKQIKKISLGCNYSIILTETNEIYICGSNNIFQLGNLKKNFNTTYQTKPQSYNGFFYHYGNNNLNEQLITRFVKLNKEITNDNFITELGMVKDISCGYEHTIILNDENQLFGSGCNYDGQLGFEEDNNRIVKGFTKIKLPIELLNDLLNCKEKIEKLICDFNNSAIITKSGKLFLCGSNANQMLGLGDKVENVKKFTQLKTSNHTLQNNTLQNDNTTKSAGTVTATATTAINRIVTDIAFGMFHTIIVTKENELFGCGCNVNGQLGLGLKKNYISRFTKINFNNGIIKKIKCGSYFTIILNNFNELFSCGENEKFQTGHFIKQNIFNFTKIKNLTNIRDFSCGDDFFIAISRYDFIYGSGENKCGQFGEISSGGGRSLFTMNHIDSRLNHVVCGKQFTYFYRKETYEMLEVKDELKNMLEEEGENYVDVDIIVVRHF
ncbi:hypothetical protein ABK040_015887 [Willaertia magna]